MEKPIHIPLPTQTLYAELVERLTVLEAHRSIGNLPGCFLKKTVKGELYYYFQYSGPGGSYKQAYVGRCSPELDKIVADFEKQKKLSRPAEEDVHRLCSQIRVGGGLATDAPSARVLKALADGGVFFLHGVLVGTHAYTVMGNLLGVAWRGGSQKTQDVDIAGEPVLRVALPNEKVDVPRILESLKMGFLPIPQLNPKRPSTSFSIRGSSLRVDILTPEVGPIAKGPVLLRHFNVAAEPLRFLDYLIEAPIKAAVVSGGGILVNVPQPARYALHKLLTSQERAASFHVKSRKDIIQAMQIMAVLFEDREGDVLEAWDDLKARGPGWIKRIRKALPLARRENPELAQRLGEIVSS